MLSLAQNHPNPFRENTSLSLKMPSESPLKLRVYNIRGQCIKTIHDQALAKGDHLLQWDGKDDSGRTCASGVFIFASLLIITSAFAFEKGTYDLGGSASLSMQKANSDDETLTTFSLSPLLGFFAAKNVCIDGILSFTSQSAGDESISVIAIGAGARYFFNNRFYVGGALQYQSQTIDLGNDEDSWFSGEATTTSTYIQPKIGMLAPLNPSVFLDFGATYQIGFGSYGGDGSGDNEYSNLNFNVGLHYFLKR